VPVPGPASAYYEYGATSQGAGRIGPGTGDELYLATAFRAKWVDMEQIEIHPTQAAGAVTGGLHGANALGVDSLGRIAGCEAAQFANG
jgi:hypothetical protein